MSGVHWSDLLDTPPTEEPVPVAFPEFSPLERAEMLLAERTTLTEVYAALATVRDTAMAEVFAEFQRASAEVNARLASELAEMQELAQALAVNEAQIKEAVLLLGRRVDGGRFQAIYTRGRVTWDAKALDGYAVGHPEILPFRKEGAPSVSLRDKQA